MCSSDIRISFKPKCCFTLTVDAWAHSIPTIGEYIPIFLKIWTLPGTNIGKGNDLWKVNQKFPVKPISPRFVPRCVQISENLRINSPKVGTLLSCPAQAQSSWCTESPAFGVVWFVSVNIVKVLFYIGRMSFQYVRVTCMQAHIVAKITCIGKIQIFWSLGYKYCSSNPLLLELNYATSRSWVLATLPFSCIQTIMRGRCAKVIGMICTTYRKVISYIIF